MAEKITIHAVTVMRDGKKRRVLPNERFDFTDEEIEQLDERSPEALRDPVNEMTDVPVPAGKGPPSRRAQAGKSAPAIRTPAGAQPDDI